MDDVRELTERVAARLGDIQGVVAVALGGAWAREGGALDADIDLLLYYHDDARPRTRDLRDLARSLNEFHTDAMVSHFWQHGPFVNGGAWLWVEGRRVGWQYRDLGHVRRSVESGRQGGFTAHYQAGYPHGFFSHYHIGEIRHCRVLFDPAREIDRLKALVHTYPKPLKLALLGAFMPEADVTLYGAQKAAAAGDVLYATGCLYRCVACLLQVLFALNEQYLAGEREALAATASFDQGPSDFADIATRILASPGASPSMLQESIGELRALVDVIQLQYVKPLGME
jgi:predicted nucleotidyltransferase